MSTVTERHATQQQPELRRTLRAADLMLIVIGSVIGSGIFIVPGTVLRQTGGHVGVMLAVWLGAGILSLLGALAYSEMAAMKPDAGGLYTYIRDTIGRFPAFLLGWTFLFVIGPGSVATLSVAFTSYFDRLLPLGPVMHRVVPVVMIAVIAFVNVRGTRESAHVQNFSTALKTGALLLLSVLFLAFGRGLARVPGHVWPATFEPSLLSGIGIATVAVLWAYEAWQYATFSAGETERPERNLPLGIGLGTGLVILVYLLANVAYLAALGPDGLQASSAVAADAARALFGPTAGVLVAVAIMISIFSAANGVTITTPRIYYRMGRDGVFFQKLGEVHPRFHTPAIAILVSSVWAAILAATGTFEQLLTYVVFAGWIFYALGGISVIVYRRRLPDAPRPFRVPGYPVTPILFVIAAAAIVINTIVTQPARAFVGLGIVALGSPAYVIWRARQRRSPAATTPAGD